MNNRNFRFATRPLYLRIDLSQLITAFLTLALSSVFAPAANAQDPVLPPTNLSLANVFDGIAGKPGFIYVNYTQSFQTHHLMDGAGDKLASPLKINSIASLHQFIYLTPVQLLGGNLGFTVIVPLAKISVTGSQGGVPTVNPGVFGDVIQGTAIQWSGKKIAHKRLSHRVELDVSAPVGSYSADYNINESAHLFTFSLYHAFTLMLNDRISISSRNQVNYNTRIIGQHDKPGAFYNGNYSVDYAVIKQLRVEAIGYFLSQFNQDRHTGDEQYYAATYGIGNTKERVLGYGAGIAYFLPGGSLVEVKSAWESAGQNRAEGIRSTLRIAMPLSK